MGPGAPMSTLGTKDTEEIWLGDVRKPGKPINPQPSRKQALKGVPGETGVP